MSSKGHDDKDLEQICSELGLKTRTLDDGLMDRYRNHYPHSEVIADAMAEMSELLDGEVVMFGGAAVLPQFLGYRKMRMPSNDLDCFTNESGLRKLYDIFADEELFFRTSNYGDVFLEYKGLPFGFDMDETHDWKIPEELWDETRKFNLDAGSVKVISPEYLITLKTRRSHVKNRIYGKDKLDVANLILSPVYKDVPELDLYKLGSLMKEHVSQDYSDLSHFLDSLFGVKEQLRTCERKIYMSRLDELVGQIKDVYGQEYMC